MIGTLLWRDYRQNRKVLMVCSAITMAPYVISLPFMVFQDKGPFSHGELFIVSLMGASLWAMILTTGISAFIAGNAFAGERADRSAEFAVCLPISRARMLASRLILAAGSAMALYLFNILILLVLSFILHQIEKSGLNLELFQGIAQSSGATMTLLFGVAWLVSSFAKSGVIAAASGLAAMILLAGGLMSIDNYAGLGSSVFGGHMHTFYAPLSVIFGLMGLVGGCIVVMRRRTP